MKKLICAAVLSLLAVMPAAAESPPAPVAVATDANAAIHNDLRALKTRLAEAVNKKDAAALMAELSSDVRFTAMDNRLSRGPAGVKAYYDEMMVGANRVVKDMRLTAEPDDLALLYGDNKVALTTGTAEAHFKLSGNREFDVPLRWTATLANDGGKWKVVSAHFGASMFDNPLMAGVQKFSYWLAGGTGLIGLLIGWLLGRRRKTA
jgi:ketosteroid isomerase-like protein